MLFFCTQISLALLQYCSGTVYIWGYILLQKLDSFRCTKHANSKKYRLRPGGFAHRQNPRCCVVMPYKIWRAPPLCKFRQVLAQRRRVVQNQNLYFCHLPSAKMRSELQDVASKLQTAECGTRASAHSPMHMRSPALSWDTGILCARGMRRAGVLLPARSPRGSARELSLIHI